jgi:uncharacterized membrane protein
MRRWLIAGGAVLVMLVAGLIALIRGNAVPLELTGSLLFGWIGFAQRVFPKVQPTTGGFVTAAVCLVVLWLGLHAFLGWLYRNFGRTHGEESPASRRWRVRWTASLLTVTVLMFVAGIAAAGVVHQMVWIARERGHWTAPWGNEGLWRANLQMAGAGLRSMGSVSGREESLASAAMWDDRGTPLHGWMTQALPYMGGMTDYIDLTIPWNDPRNCENFKTFIPFYLNPAVRVGRDREGYGLSHFAGNSHVLKRQPVPLSALPNGTSNTLLIGEVAAHFQAWGRPLTERDPTAGLNTTPDGFASPTGNAVLFVFVDGSVRPVRPEVDPEVLNRMAGVR